MRCDAGALRRRCCHESRCSSKGTSGAPKPELHMGSSGSYRDSVKSPDLSSSKTESTQQQQKCCNIALAAATQHLQQIRVNQVLLGISGAVLDKTPVLEGSAFVREVSLSVLYSTNLARTE